MTENIFKEVISISKRCVPFMAVGILFAGVAYKYGQIHHLDTDSGMERFMMVSSIMMP